ncbi:MAG: radical SAM protein, partial [Thermoplasmatota archaeon]
TIINERYQPVIVENKYDLVIIHFTTASALQAYKIADEFRKKQQGLVVLCGLHASALPEEALTHADGVLLGRGEGNVLDLISDIKDGKIKSVYQPKEYHDFSIPKTKSNLPGFVLMGAVEATRGCPYHCRFCPESNTTCGNVFFARPVDEVIDEIKQIPQKIIMFYDLSLTIDPAYTRELFSKMIPLKKRFFCNGNVDVLSGDKRLIALSKQAGCMGWLIGFESVSQQTMNEVGKKSNKVSEYQKVVHDIHRHHMMVIGDFMFGFDTDSPSVFSDTLSVIRRLHIDVADFSILTPFPGTALFDQFEKENRILTYDWAKYNMHSVVFKPKQMNPEQLKAGVKYLYQQFYHPFDSVKRMSQSLPFGLFPFAAVFSRNLIAMIASQKLQ